MLLLDFTKPVADAGFGRDVARLSGVFFNFLASLWSRGVRQTIARYLAGETF